MRHYADKEEEKLTDKERDLFNLVMMRARQLGENKINYVELHPFKILTEDMDMSGPGVTPEFKRVMDSCIIRFTRDPHKSWGNGDDLVYIEQHLVEVAHHVFGATDMHHPTDTHGVFYYANSDPTSSTGYRLVVRKVLIPWWWDYFPNCEDYELEKLKAEFYEFLGETISLSKNYGPYGDRLKETP